MIKKWLTCLLAFLLVFSMTLTSLVVYADEEGTTPEDTTEETPGEDSSENQPENGGSGIAGNKGASESLEGFELVSSDSDDPSNLDLYFYEKELAFKIAQKDAAGNIVKVWSSQLLPEDLGIDPELSAVPDLTGKSQRTELFAYDKQSLSLFVINYVNLGNTVTTTTYTTTSYEQQKELVGEVVKTGSGVSFKVNFPTLNIVIPITVEVDGQELNVTIPKDGIYENTEGAEEVQAANEKMESLIEEINDLIEKTKRLIPKKKKETEEDERNKVGKYFETITQQLQLAKEAVITGLHREVSPEAVVDSMKGVKERLSREQYFANYDGVEENTLKIEELLVECMEKYDVIASEIAFGVYSLEVMPFLGSATITEKGYVFYPDGAGAISYFDTPHPALLGHYEQPIYMDHVFNLETMWNDEGTSNPSLYPVWGVNKVDYGFVGIIEKGDTDANIEYWPGNEDYVLNRIGSSFMFRRKSKYIKGTASFESYEIERIEYDRKLKYIFLEEGKADYSAMANAYREYLKEKEMLNQGIKDGEKMPLAVDFLGGVKVQEVIWESTIPMTTYEQIQSTLAELKKDGVDTKIFSNVYDWTKQDYNPNPLNADGALGGKKDLELLTQYAAENDVILGFEVNPVWAQKQYSTGEEMNKFFVRDATTLLVNYNSNTYIFSPAYIQEKYASKLVSKLKTYGANCAQLNAIGYYLYYDHSKFYKTVTSRADTAQIFAEVAKLANEELGYSSVSGANMFMWKYASRIDSMPLSDLEYLYSDQSVPFLQMVLHGSIPYSGSVPYNVMYDDTKQKLEYIEFGCMPYFFLTESEAADLSTSREATWEYDWLYSSDLATWYDPMVTVYKEFSENVGYLWSEEIVHHMQIQEGVKRVEYSDGSVIYVNYNAMDVTFNDPVDQETIEVKAQSYIVRRGAEE